jgi:hypothetical protein
MKKMRLGVDAMRVRTKRLGYRRVKIVAIREWQWQGFAQQPVPWKETNAERGAEEPFLTVRTKFMALVCLRLWHHDVNKTI